MWGHGRLLLRSCGDGRTARGTLVNRGGNYGLMFMVRREFLGDFKHLLTEEGRQAEAQRRWIGIENLSMLWTLRVWMLSALLVEQTRTKTANCSIGILTSELDAS